MVHRNSRGEIVRTSRLINTNVNFPMLVGADWQDVAFAEVLRLELVAEGLCKQLEDRELCGHAELRRAVEALRAAKLALEADDEANQQRNRPFV